MKVICINSAGDEKYHFVIPGLKSTSVLILAIKNSNKIPNLLVKTKTKVRNQSIFAAKIYLCPISFSFSLTIQQVISVKCEILQDSYIFISTLLQVLID